MKCKIIIVILIICFISGCNTNNEIESIDELDTEHGFKDCTIELLDSKTVWTVIEFEEFEFVRKKDLDEVCPVEDTYPGYQEGFRDLQIFKDMCFKREALLLNNVGACNKVETCFIKNYCIVELNIKNDENYCSSSSGINEDYCEILNLRNNHGYRPTFSANCGKISNSNLKKFCETAYMRKE